MNRTLGTAALVISLAACKGATPLQPTPQPAPIPTPLTPVPPRAGVTVTGKVLELTATGETRPVPNLRMKVRTGGQCDGAVCGDALAEVITDARGLYTMTDVSAYVLFFQTAPGSEYRFPCDWFPRPLTGISFVDLPVVHTSWSGNRPPVNWMSTWVYGTVSERNGSVLPVAGATVTLDRGVPDPPATTNANGFYMICSIVGADQSRTISAQKTGYNPAARDYREGGEVNLELTRK